MIISKTPLRVSFFGGGTDFKEYFSNCRFGYGTVLSTAIEMSVYITVNKMFDDSIRVCYSENEIVSSVDDIRHNIIREALKLLGIEKSIEIIYTSDLPIKRAGIGLASSSAIAVGVLNALYAYKGIYVTPEELARQACRLEIDVLKNPIGIQDQYAVAYGGFRRYKFYADDTVDAIPVVCRDHQLEKFQSNLMLFFTGLTRDSAVILKEQNDTIQQKMPLLDSLVEDTEQAYRCFLDGQFDQVGALLDSTWKKKKTFAKNISNPQIEEMYDAGRRAGALGGKILGAGGGGFLLLYVPRERQDAVKRALSAYKFVEFKAESSGSRIVFSE